MDWKQLITICQHRQMRENTLKLRGALGGLFDCDDQPLPCHFGHFVFVLSLFHLPLFVISLGDHEEPGSTGLEIVLFFAKMSNAFLWWACAICP